MGLCQTTTGACADPGRIVIKREALLGFLREHLEADLNLKVFNQLVSRCARVLPKQPLTIKGASRITYLLAEGEPNSAIMVVDWILSNPQEIPKAAQAAQAQALEGRRFATPTTTRGPL